jgi:hypothetical protein
MSHLPINTTAFQEFANRWIAKSSRYRGQTLSNSFDKFFTLFVVYNRAYDEAARFVLVTHPQVFYRKGFSLSSGRVGANSTQKKLYVSRLGDRVKATDGVAAFCGKSLQSEVFTNDVIVQALKELESLVLDRRFYFFFDRDTGIPNPELDLKALRGMRRGIVIDTLEVIYQIRCNLFHGQKEFEQEQLAVLRPVNDILDAVVRHVVQKVINHAATEANAL